MNNMFKTELTTILETPNTKYVNNNKNIPEWVAQRYVEISESGYSGTPKVGTISTTEFAKSDRQILLNQQRLANPYQVTVNVDKIVNSALGTGMHEIILQQEEPRQFMTIGKWKISGQLDKLKDNMPYDLKNVSVYEGKKLMRDIELCPYYQDLSLDDLYVKHHTLFKYVNQLSQYSMLYDLNSEIGKITFIFNNWSQRDNKTFPTKTFELTLKLASKEKMLDYLTRRLDRIEKYTESGYLPECTDSATGKSSTSTFKIVKYGGKRAVANSGGEFNTAEEASVKQMEFPGTELLEVKKSSEAILCLQYCSFNNVVNGKTICEQGKLIKENYGK